MTEKEMRALAEAILHGYASIYYTAGNDMHREIAVREAVKAIREHLAALPLPPKE